MTSWHISCIWDQELIPSEMYPPMDYEGPVRPTVPYVTMDLIKQVIHIVVKDYMIILHKTVC
jgi:hypothetical protein